MEAALLLPVVLLVLALLLQPACVLYTRSVMAATAYELVRLAGTSRSSDDEMREYALRRLSAVPEVPLFHEGGKDAWEVSVDGPSAEGRVNVRVCGRVRPLPLLGSIVAAFGELEGGDVRVVVEATGAVRPGWVGGSYGDWVGMWG